MSRIRYSVAMSLDGFIAGPNGEADWFVQSTGRYEIFEFFRELGHLVSIYSACFGKHLKRQ